jgi:Rrf2 family protein
VLWLLNKAGLVSSTRGTKGGYQLARPASVIRLSEIIKVLDEDVLEGHCKSYPGVLDSCVHTGDCGIRSVIVNVHEVVERALSGITLAQLTGTEQKVDTTLHQIRGMREAAESLGGPAR